MASTSPDAPAPPTTVAAVLMTTATILNSSGELNTTSWRNMIVSRTDQSLSQPPLYTASTGDVLVYHSKSGRKSIQLRPRRLVGSYFLSHFSPATAGTGDATGPVDSLPRPTEKRQNQAAG